MTDIRQRAKEIAANNEILKRELWDLKNHSPASGDLSAANARLLLEYLRDFYPDYDSYDFEEAASNCVGQDLEHYRGAAFLVCFDEAYSKTTPPRAD